MSELKLKPVDGGTTLRLRVRPGASRNAVSGCHGGSLKVAVAAAPERGKANRAVVELLARALGVPKADVRLVAGETSRDKVIRVGLSPREVRQRLGL